MTTATMTARATPRSTTGKGPPLWTPGDWNAYFGFGTNILVNLLTLTGLLRFVLKMPDELVFGRILPATGLMMCLSTMYYAWLAYRLAWKTGRTDVCALPSGISVPHMFVVTFVVMLPIASKTGDSFTSAASASFLIARSGCVAGTRVSGDISISIDDCLVFSPRMAPAT